ncbi:MAG: cytochrome c biogenesis protein CcdA [Eubacterium sp.]|nr:cytochrome c biogenesis protein CcdA [Eubacterium sp.]
MAYLITFLEGMISFISPCMLPMLPIYVSYFAGGADKKEKIVIRAISFVLGFTVVFSAMGLFAGTLGHLLAKYNTVVNIVCGTFVVIFGLSYLDIIRLPFFKGLSKGKEITSFFSAFMFGVVYSVSLTPCVGAFLGSAISLAATSSGALKGTILLLTYSLGLGIPFAVSAILIDELNKVFTFIKNHYKVINLTCGIFLIAVGFIMVFGLLNRFMSLFR